jgi:hypothetical protein
MSDQENTAVFREVQKFGQLWVWVLALGAAVGVIWTFVEQIIFERPVGNKPASDVAVWILLAMFGVALPLFFLALRLIVEVRDDVLFVRFYPFRSRIIPLSEIRHHEARTYRPIREYGGWGIRWGRGGRAYNVSGDRGVQLEFQNGKRLLIGSQRAEELAEAITERKERSS